MHAYCLFCETQRCRQIAEIIRKEYGLICFAPTIIQRKWIKGIPTEEIHDWLPGYLFLYSDEPVSQHLRINGIIRVLGNGELAGQDLKFAEMVYSRGGTMGIAPLIQEGDQCRIADPAWQELQGQVVKMDFGRKRCCVEFVFDGIARTVWLGYDIIHTDN